MDRKAGPEYEYSVASSLRVTWRDCKDEKKRFGETCNKRKHACLQTSWNPAMQHIILAPLAKRHKVTST
jgi:hypothetical protein